MVSNQVGNGGGTRVGFIGLGAMGGGMAATLVKEGFKVCGYDVYEPAMKKLEDVGGLPAKSCSVAAQDAEILVVMVTTAAQADAALFGDEGAVQGLPDGATVILCSTVPPEFARKLDARLAAVGRDLGFIDAPVSGGVAKAARGALTIMASAAPRRIAKGEQVLRAMSERLYVVGHKAGDGSAVKMINQLLAGVHIAAAAEAMALAARAGLDTRLVYEIISNAAGNSWMFENRVPHMLDDDFTPLSAVNIFVKDLGIVLGEGQGMGFPTPVAAVAHQQFLAGAAAGLGKLDDSAVVKVYEKLSGVSVSRPKATEPVGQPNGAAAQSLEDPKRVRKEELLQGLPKEWQQQQQLEKDSSASLAPSYPSTPLLVVLDDDPTGTQTVHNIDVLTRWDVPTLVSEMRREPKAFFILTNSRALPTEQARQLTKDICGNVRQAAELAGVVPAGGHISGSKEHRGLSAILRGDSTLRGHFPAEMEAAAEALKGEFDAWLLCPFFLEGGRYTIDNVHYVADRDDLVPAALTEFAKDSAFGYNHSDLTEWVAEKTKGAVSASTVASISLATIRQKGPSAVADELQKLPKGSVCIINAASNSDLAVVAAALALAESQGKSFLCRTAASFVSARLSIPFQPPLGPEHFVHSSPFPAGGLVVVGSYVAKTTTQVSCLLQAMGTSLHVITVDAEKASQGLTDSLTSAMADEADRALQSGNDVIILTSRALITSSDPSLSLSLGQNISNSLVDIVAKINTRPKYILAKGGITSSDVATKALGVDRATVAGQAMPGVPLWSLGANSKFPGIPYIVFPGNVGGPDAILALVQRWRGAPPRRTSKTFAMLKAAEEGGYAVGAFNIYNLEGVRAVVRAAEDETSPAIIQLHPAALALGGKPLLSACVAAAASAKVPVSVHLDHGTDEAMLTSAVAEGAFDSLMVDGSALDLGANVLATQKVAQAAHARGLLVEAELGRIAGVEDGVSVADLEARMTREEEAEQFLLATGVDALAVCVGNRHGPYPAKQLEDETKILDLKRLKALKQVATKHQAFLVLHGASGLPTSIVKECISLGVRKFNVNTEVRKAGLEAFASKEASGKDLVEVLQECEERMAEVVRQKMRDFGSSGKAL